MAYITTALTIIITLNTINANSYSYNYDYNPYAKQYTRNVTIKQGIIRGIIKHPQKNSRLSAVEQYLGIPYAAPPVGELRFMPSGSAPSWSGVRYADDVGPVCPQNFPETKTMAPERKEAFLKLKRFLMNQSEDCLYLNIYTPFQDSGTSYRQFPVIVFIHGESFEWNSGNPYDGSVLASYGKVVVITLNFRLGVLGFLKADTEEYSKSNFGLVDQIAALLWVKENIAAFGGNPEAVTLLGHGSGAVCASLLMLSPMVLLGNQILFQRAILMSGTSLSDWALAGNPREVTYQVAQALNCQIQDDFAACLRRKRLEEIMAAVADTPAYRTRFGPVVDSLVVPNDPLKSMTTYCDIFKRFELMYGVTEMESIHLLGPVALTHGMLEKERDQELRKYLRSRCEMKPELCVYTTLAAYTENQVKFEKYEGYTGTEPDKASLARDALLDILSDGRTVAPVVQMGKYHATLNQESYFYVFAHKTYSRDYLRNKSFVGEELPYVFGVPLDGPSFHFTDQYTEKEMLLSEIIMTYFCNFAYTGNPNVPRKIEYYSLSPMDWIQFDVDWPEFDVKQERYLKIDVPPKVNFHYRKKEMIFWNEVFPDLSSNRTSTMMVEQPQFKKTPLKPPPLQNFNKPPFFIKGYDPNYTKKPVTTSNHTEQVFGVLKKMGYKEDNMQNTNTVHFGTVLQSPPNNKLASTINILIIVGSVFLLVNLFLFIVLYYKCYRVKRSRNAAPKMEEKNNSNEDIEKRTNTEKHPTYSESGCNFMRLINNTSGDTYEAVKRPDTPKKGKLTRQMSNSTIDAHTKVREWITQEIVYKYSPRFLRRPRLTSTNFKFDESINQNDVLRIHSDVTEQNSTLGRSPTRPVSPIDQARPILTKSLSNQSKGKIEKVSVAVDATPTGRGASVLAQQPIEFTKSLDHYRIFENEVPLRRSMTLDDFSIKKVDKSDDVRRSIAQINMESNDDAPTIIKIGHAHSNSEPVEDIYAYTKAKRLRTFDPNNDVNVTSRDDNEAAATPLTPEESLMTIKRRNFPKVLPDYPNREAMAQKRRSMPAPSLFSPIPELGPVTKLNLTDKFKMAPLPPVRTCSTLGRKIESSTSLPVCTSAPMLAEDVSSSPEPEITCNNLYVGPLIPKKQMSSSFKDELDTHQVYSSLNNLKDQKKAEVTQLKAIITTDPMQPIKKVEPKVVIRPQLTRNLSDPKTRVIPRVLATDNDPTIKNVKVNKFAEETKACKNIGDNAACSKSKENVSHIPVKTSAGACSKNSNKTQKPSHIPTLAATKGSNTSLVKESSSSESNPSSEDSDTGTVVKKL